MTQVVNLLHLISRSYSFAVCISLSYSTFTSSRGQCTVVINYKICFIFIFIFIVMMIVIDNSSLRNNWRTLQSYLHLYFSTAKQIKSNMQTNIDCKIYYVCIHATSMYVNLRMHYFKHYNNVIMQLSFLLRSYWEALGKQMHYVTTPGNDFVNVIYSGSTEQLHWTSAMSMSMLYRM